MDMREEDKTPVAAAFTWSRRDEFPRPGLIATLIIVVGIVLGAAMTPKLGLLGYALMPLTVAFSAFLIIMTRSLFLLFGIPAVFTLSILITSDVISGLAALAFIPAAVILALLLPRQTSRMTTVYLMAAGIGAVLLSASAIRFAVENGGITPSLLSARIQEATAALTASNIEAASQLGADISGIATQTATFVMLIPAIYAALVCIISLLSQQLLYCVFVSCRLPSLVTPKLRRITMQPASAFVYTLAYLFAVIFSSEQLRNRPPFIVAYSIIILLAPPFTFIGTAAAARLIKERYSMMTHVVIIFALIILFVLLTYVFAVIFVTLTSSIGVFLTFRGFYSENRKNAGSK